MRFLPIVLAAVATGIASTSAYPSTPASSQPEQIEVRTLHSGNHGDVSYHRRGHRSLGGLFSLNRRSDSTSASAALPQRPERKQPSTLSALQQAELKKVTNGRSAIVIQGSSSYAVNTTASANAARSLEEVTDEVDEPEEEPVAVASTLVKKKRAGTCIKKTATSTSTTSTSTKKTTSTSTSTSTSTKKTTSTSTSTSTKKTTSTSTSTTTKAASTSTKKTTTSSSTKTTSTAAVTSVAASDGPMIMGGYWPSWAEMTPEDIDWNLFDLMAFAFATPTTTGGVSIDSSDAALLKRLVTAGHNGGAKVIVSLGGWDNGQGFSPSVSTAALRQTFATSISNFMTTYNLDGVDLDWEYPNSAYATNYNSADAANFQTFLQTLRATLGADAIITAAVSDETWISSTGGTVSNVARAAGALSYIMIMNYDVWGESSTPGPNAPLADLCGNSTQPTANAEAAVKQWYAAGMPKKKMLLGVPYYGYVQDSTKTTLIQRSLLDEPVDEQFEAKRRAVQNRALGGRPRRSDDPRRSPPEAELEKRKTSLSTGQMNFNEIFANGAIKRGTGSNVGTYVAGSGWVKYWDDCSDTPYLSSGNQVITYDDPTSLYDKAYFARESGLGGTSMWSVDGDTEYWNLTLAMRSGMGI